VSYTVGGHALRRRRRGGDAPGVAGGERDARTHQAITLYKNNSDGKGNSYGTHENYLVAREVEFTQVVRAMVPHFVSRQIIVGAGKVGAETEPGMESDPAFQLSSRAEFFEEVVGLETTLKRPIINTRDEPHSDAERFRRLHVIIGDANMSQVATFVKLGSTSLLLAALEDGGLAGFPSMPRHPSPPCARSHSTRCWNTPWRARMIERGPPGTFKTNCGPWPMTSWNAVCVGGRDARRGSDDPVQWRELLDGVRDDHEAVADRVDWVAKLRMVNGYQQRHGLANGDARLRAIDLQYHDLRAERSLSQRVGLAELHPESNVREAVHNPPETTRAYFRGQCVARYPMRSWPPTGFGRLRSRRGSLQRVPMLDPLRGTKELTGELLETSATAQALLEALDR